jgi:hypothetical protein
MPRVQAETLAGGVIRILEESLWPTLSSRGLYPARPRGDVPATDRISSENTRFGFSVNRLF